MEITEKIAYIKGLLDGFGVDDKTKEGKIIHAVVDVLDDIALSIGDLEDSVDLMGEQIDLLDEDMDEIYSDCFDDDDEDDFDGELYEVTCPSCGEVICVDEDMLDEGEINCPACGEPLEFDLEGILDECDCGCKSEDKKPE